jgi:uncharacterized protein with von Willebrand factor type A (vWA) domain
LKKSRRSKVKRYLTGPKNRAAKGRQREKSVMEQLRRAGWFVRDKRGSKGIDVVAFRPGHFPLAISVGGKDKSLTGTFRELNEYVREEFGHTKFIGVRRILARIRNLVWEWWEQDLDVNRTIHRLIATDTWWPLD